MTWTFSYMEITKIHIPKSTREIESGARVSSIPIIPIHLRYHCTILSIYIDTVAQNESLRMSQLNQTGAKIFKDVKVSNHQYHLLSNSLNPVSLYYFTIKQTQLQIPAICTYPWTSWSLNGTLALSFPTVHLVLLETPMYSGPLKMSPATCQNN